MKPNKYQIELAKKIAEEIVSIVDTNDINSPSHYNLLDESARQIVEEYYSFYDEKTVRKHQELFADVLDSLMSALIAIRKLGDYEQNNL